VYTRTAYPDSQSLVQPAAAQARELITAHLPAAGPQYCWAELLPAVITTVLDRARTQAELSHEDRCRLEGAARRAARDWVPLHEVERACQIVVGCVCRVLWDTIELGHCDGMLGLSRWAADKLPEALGFLRAAYVEEMRRLGGRRPEDNVIVGTLLDGGDARAAACAVGRPLPEPCAVLALACAGAGGPAGTDPGFAFTAPPDGVLDGLADLPGMLCAANWEQSVLVVVFGVPPGPVGDSVRAVRQAAEHALDACESAYRRSFVAGLAISETAAGAGRAAREAVDIAFVLAHSDPHRRVAFSEEIALDVLVGAHVGLQRRLVDRVADVAARPDLWATLREFYRSDLDRGRTARRLGIHRSTLDYRLSRVEQLTGTSPTSVQGILLFAAAHAAASACGPAEPPAGTAPAPGAARLRHSL
jgi:hypothetical protein